MGNKAKSWTPAVGVADDWGQSGVLALPRPKFALRMLLAVLSVLFLLIFTSYLVRMDVPDWRPLEEPWLLWVNTAFLVLSSGFMQAARVRASAPAVERVRGLLLVAGFFAFAFLLGQLWVWKELVDQGYFLAANPSSSFFYLITAIHGLHVVAGLVAWGRTTRRLSSREDPGAIALGVELCALYWHFLLIVWLVLFGLMLST